LHGNGGLGKSDLGPLEIDVVEVVGHGGNHIAARNGAGRAQAVVARFKPDGEGHTCEGLKRQKDVFARVEEGARLGVEEDFDFAVVR